MPAQARACTAQGRLVRQKSRQRSPFGRVKSRKQPENSVEKKPISKTLNCPPRLLTTASLHE
ncbi:hypothetical protein AJ88_41870 [Mesorhizobium amorphae CCBAU 01583]|nr:hypothetical protein AJ88_41870 [Mesorhizobium amorphae CCBAU 01583]